MKERVGGGRAVEAGRGVDYMATVEGGHSRTLRRARFLVWNCFYTQGPVEVACTSLISREERGEARGLTLRGSVRYRRVCVQGVAGSCLVSACLRGLQRLVSVLDVGLKGALRHFLV